MNTVMSLFVSSLLFSNILQFPMLSSSSHRASFIPKQFIPFNAIVNGYASQFPFHVVPSQCFVNSIPTRLRPSGSHQGDFVTCETSWLFLETILIFQHLQVEGTDGYVTGIKWTEARDTAKYSTTGSFPRQRIIWLKMLTVPRLKNFAIF